MKTFPVGSDKEALLSQRMAQLGVREADLAETFVRSSGRGGQKVNKTATCVVLLHRPTGLQVKCQATRQQGLNRFWRGAGCWIKLRRQTGRVAAERARREKIRRQKRRRSRRAKERLLADKAHHAAKKEARRRVSVD